MNWKGIFITKNDSYDVAKKLSLSTSSLFQIVGEDYTLSDILNNITKEDLRCLQLR